jgi:hypothetical protein
MNNTFFKFPCTRTHSNRSHKCFISRAWHSSSAKSRDRRLADTGKRERVLWLTSSETCGLQADQGNSRVSVPGRRQSASRHRSAPNTRINCLTRATCLFRISTKDGRYVETRPTEPISIVLPFAYAPEHTPYYHRITLLHCRPYFKIRPRPLTSTCFLIHY